MKTFIFFIAGAFFLWGLLYIGGYLPYTKDRGSQTINTKKMNKFVTGQDDAGCAKCSWS
ncbi:MAG: hypothetical protein K0U29_01790 [Gammaproteobacteria bacterium]|nr:hypothetical protein [Gammaproteobacteria bacterium]MCH9743641.1 hypothetical protein [Gammaproteobacteria bacterium]